MARGLVYGVGVGPGDPELMTLKAVRIIRACPVIASPGNSVEESLAYKIAVSAVPELAAKEFVPLPSPMVRDRMQVETAHARNARVLERHLDDGRDVAFLTLGDPSIYSTFGYLRLALEADGYGVSTVSGVPSFCAAAARLGTTLMEGDEPLLVMPAALVGDLDLPRSGSCVLVKAGSRMREIKRTFGERGFHVRAVERCGLEGERVYPDLEHIPDDAGYLTLVLATQR